MNLGLLKVFQVVTEEGSFSRAGQKLRRTQPAISLALKRLEEDLGVQLIDRSTRTMYLTDAGKLLADYSNRFQGLESKLATDLVELRDLQAGKLTIGANESAALYLLGPLEEFRRKHTSINIELRRSQSSHIPEYVLDGSLELGAISYDPMDPKLTVFNLYQDRLTFIVSPQHQLAKRRHISIKELGQETFIAHNVVSPYRARVIEAFRNHQVPLNMAIEMPTIETIRRLVQQNLGVAFLPKMCVAQQILDGSLKEINVRELFMERSIRLVCPAQRILSQASKAFLELVSNTTVPAAESTQ